MFQESTLNVLQKQYGYTALSDLMMRRAAVWDKYMGNISQTFISEILDYNTCLPEALDWFWGKMLKISRSFTGEDGEIFTLNDDQFREIIKIKLFFWDGSLISLNEFFRNIFAGRGSFFAVDTQDMTTIKFVIGFSLTLNEIAMFTKFDIFPRPAGIGSRIQIVPAEQKYFGFAGYQTYTESPVTVGFGTYGNGNPTGDGKMATYNDEI